MLMGHMGYPSSCFTFYFLPSKEASLKQQLEAVEGSPGLQGEVKALQTQLAEEQEHVAGARSQMDALKREMVEERAKVDQERHRYIGGGGAKMDQVYWRERG